MELRILIVSFILLFVKVCMVPVNERPIIGILTEEISNNSVLSGSSFIMASYVKYIEAGGARVIPIPIYKSKKYYRYLLSKINGVLIPGGNDILDSDGFGRTGKLIFDIAVEMNDMGNYFPLWGTCLGFEMLNYAAVKKQWMKSCDAYDQQTNIGLVKGFNNSRMFADMSLEMRNRMQSENVSLHFHRWCLTPQNYSVSGLDKFYKILAVNEDSRNLTFVSVIEAYKYPFYGVAFHPEKIIFDWTIYETPAPHSGDAVKVSQFFCNFFINEARKNLNHFATKAEENSLLIYNYNPQHGSDELSAQIYIFE